MPMKLPPFFRFFLTHTKAAVLYVKPHASMTLMASAILGNVAHMKQAHPPPQISRTGRAHISAVVMVG